MEIRKILENSILFNGLPDKCLDTIQKFAQTMEFKKGDIIFRENEPGESMMIIAKGKVSIVHNLNNPRDSVQLAILEAGTFFGEMSMIDISPRSASAVANENCEIVVIKGEEMISLFQMENGLEFLPILVNISRGLSEKLRKANFLIATVAKLINNYNF